MNLEDDIEMFKLESTTIIENTKDKVSCNKIIQMLSHSKPNNVLVIPKSGTIQNVICSESKDQAGKFVSSNCLRQSKASTIFGNSKNKKIF